MTWKIEISCKAEKQLKELNKSLRTRIIQFLKERVQPAADPRRLAKSLKGDKGGLWRFRVGDYRIICDIRGEEIKILVLTIGHRKEIYKKTR
ncbi:type II toxin-antitoxin system RelE/ParE family toxin [Maridesulfovibrio sp.]|uniref:type II toxin-antitoxin system RelE family toxin n=1 Tax=Maridesulfovibrio sp. TaxID=2795000 RepID=UPI002A188DDA|nr:type II toxin-antitoxin system RelE/ParE family toxin [Maridesulfovibrio sp.]